MFSSTFWEEAVKVYPFNDDRFTEVLKAIKEVVANDGLLPRGCKFRGVVGVRAPTGSKKTVSVGALAVAIPVFEGRRVTVLTPTLAGRTEVLARILQAIRKVRESEELRDYTPRVLVMYSKIMTCTSGLRNIREVLDAIREEEGREEPDHEKLKKLTAVFYSRCYSARLRRKCKEFVSSRKAVLDKAVAELSRGGPVYVVGVLTDDIRERLTQLAGSDVLDYVVDVREVALKYGVCPYELAMHLMRFVDVVVLDMSYLYPRVLRDDVWRLLFNDSRVVLVDEVHEVLRNIYPEVTVSESSPLKELPSSRLLADFISRMVSKYAWKEEVIEGVKYVVAVPPSALSREEVKELEGIVARLERELRGLKNVKEGRKLLIEGDVSLLKNAVMLERRGAKVSDTASNNGILVFSMRCEERGGVWRPVEYSVIPVIFTKTLKSGVDFKVCVSFSATLRPQHLSILHHIHSRDAKGRIVTLPYSVGVRETYLIATQSRYDVRGKVLEVVESLIKGFGKDKVVVVASSTWGIKDLAEVLGYEYVFPRRLVMSREAEVLRLRQLLHSSGKVLIHLSPHTSFALSVNIPDPDEGLDVLVIAPGEAILPPSHPLLAEVGVLTVKYGMSEWLAWDTAVTSRAVNRVIQAVGRFQRSNKHRLTVVFIGRLFPRHLRKVYEDMYDVSVVYEGPLNPKEIVEVIAGWLGAQ